MRHSARESWRVVRVAVDCGGEQQCAQRRVERQLVLDEATLAKLRHKEAAASVLVDGRVGLEEEEAAGCGELAVAHAEGAHRLRRAYIQVPLLMYIRRKMNNWVRSVRSKIRNAINSLKPPYRRP